MSLRHKFAFLGLLYACVITINVTLCVWCLYEYYGSLLMGLPAAAMSPRAADFGPIEHGGDAATERRVLSILAMNATFGLSLGLIGLWLIRRWIMLPVSSLHEATVRLAAGDWSHRVRLGTRDEFGLLGLELDDMVQTVLQMQQELVRREKRAVAAQSVSCVVHSTRGPLTGIRWLAEVLAMKPDATPAIIAQQERIVAQVDRVLSWLQRFRDTISAISLNVEETPIRDVIRDAATHCGKDPIVEIDPELETVHLDRSQFALALEAVLGHAGEAEAATRMCLNARRLPDRTDRWRLSVTIDGDEAPERPARSAGRSDSPFGESRPLTRAAHSIIDRVVRLHGGTWKHGDPTARGGIVITLPVHPRVGALESAQGDSL